MNEVLQSQETIKLFEYEDPKPDLDDALEHHGILGMHWGQRNGPPYPLDSKVSTGKRLKKAGGTGSISRKRRRALKKARKARAKNLKIKTEQKLQEQQRQKSKEDIIKSKDVKSMLDNVDMFTTQEINDMLNRIGSEQRLQAEVSKQIEANKSVGRKLVDVAKKNVKEAAVNVAGQAVRKGTEVLAKKAVTELTKDASPETKKMVDQIFNIERPKEKEQVKVPDTSKLSEMVKNMGNYSTSDLQEMAKRINTENTMRKLLADQEEQKKKK